MKFSRRQHNIVQRWENEQTYFAHSGYPWLENNFRERSVGQRVELWPNRSRLFTSMYECEPLVWTVSSWSLNCWAIAWMIVLPSLEQGIRTRVPGLFFSSRILHLFHKTQLPSGLLLLGLVWSTFFTTSLLNSLHKCQASLREHGPQKALREVTYALTNEYDQNHVKLSDPLAELGRPVHSSPSRCILPKQSSSFWYHYWAFGTSTQGWGQDTLCLPHSLCKLLLNLLSCRWCFFFFSMIAYRNQEHDMLPIGIGEENKSKTIWPCLKSI